MPPSLLKPFPNPKEPLLNPHKTPTKHMSMSLPKSFQTPPTPLPLFLPKPVQTPTKLPLNPLQTSTKHMLLLLKRPFPNQKLKEKL